MNELQITDSSKINKWWVLLSGIMLTILGLYTYKSPGLTIISLTYYIALVKIFSGSLGIFTHFKNKNDSYVKMLLPMSIIDLIFGLFLLFSPMFKLTLIIFAPYYFGTWAIVRGVVVIYTSFSDKDNIDNWFLQALIGVIYVIAGIFFFVNPLISTFELIIVIGIMLMIMGISTIIQFIFLLFKKQ